MFDFPQWEQTKRKLKELHIRGLHFSDNNHDFLKFVIKALALGGNLFRIRLRNTDMNTRRRHKNVTNRPPADEKERITKQELTIVQSLTKQWSPSCSVVATRRGTGSGTVRTAPIGRSWERTWSSTLSAVTWASSCPVTCARLWSPVGSSWKYISRPSTIVGSYVAFWVLTKKIRWSALSQLCSFRWHQLCSVQNVGMLHRCGGKGLGLQPLQLFPQGRLAFTVFLFYLRSRGNPDQSSLSVFYCEDPDKIKYFKMNWDPDP